MGIKGLDHLQIAIPAGGEEAARDFYGRLLGFSEVVKPPALEGRGGCWFAAPAVAIHLGVEEPFQPAAKAHPAFLVEDLSALRNRLEEAGFEVIEDGALPGVMRFYSNDPFGNRLEFIQLDGTSSKQGS